MEENLLCPSGIKRALEEESKIESKQGNEPARAHNPIFAIHSVNEKRQDIKTALEMDKITLEPKLKRPRRTRVQSNKFIINDETYRIGEAAYVKSTASPNQIIRIEKIIWDKIDEDTLPLLEVKWFYRRGDLEKDNVITKEDTAYISDNELFETNCLSKINADAITGKCYIWSIEEYDRQAEVCFDDYYTRAAYDVILKKIDPSPTDWKRECLCKKPLNPSLLYVLCESCKKWFHPSCVGLKNEDASNIKEFICELCQASAKKSNSNETKEPIETKSPIFKCTRCQTTP